MSFLKSLKNAFHSPTVSSGNSPAGSPTRSATQLSTVRPNHLTRPPEKVRSLSFDSSTFSLSRKSSAVSLKDKDNPAAGSNSSTHGFSDVILCRICEEMIPSYELEAHSETCRVTTEYAFKLHECDGKLGRLVQDVVKRKADILAGVSIIFVYNALHLLNLLQTNRYVAYLG